ncbi:hypothetical protein B0H15DRAFT_869180 [Mycena belliarum]|uniref:MYND-type domain-containing protein n=1 Tax=Mycena belliarum TaxID=1033014 RepID=A0AAD6TRE1_9AGAR|nr:hypothetical protein B0H15DRAFT_869180 [Mycena belliae]
MSSASIPMAHRRLHESLRPERFIGLCTTDRVLAKEAIKGSLPCLRGVIALLEVDCDLVGFLPIFFHHLDSTNIPNDEAMDTQTLPPDTLSMLTCAFLSLEGLYNCRSPQGAFPFLWTRIWPWVKFFDVYHLRMLDSPSHDVLRARFFCIITRLLTLNSPTAREISTTPGVATLVAQAWGAYFREPNTKTEMALRHVPEFFTAASAFEYDFDELMEAAGGESALAEILTKLVDLLLAEHNTTQRGTVHLCAVLNLSLRSAGDGWLSVLLSHGYLRCSIAILLFVTAQSSIPGPSLAAGQREMYTELYKVAWNEFWRLVTFSPVYSYILEALDAGVLTLIVETAITATHLPVDGAAMPDLFTLALLPSTIYYPILSRLGDILPRLDEQTSTSAFRSSSVYPAWQSFADLVAERLAIKRRFDSGEFLDRRACDNLECGRIYNKVEFRRCGGCKYQHYCSEKCQTQDWRTGHRKRCAISRSPEIWHTDHLDGPAYLTHHDRLFLRALVACDFDRHREKIYLIRIVRMREHGFHHLSTIINYSYGRPKIDVRLDPNHGSEWCSRAARSRGRMQTNLVFLSHEPKFWLMPTRWSDSRVMDMLYTLSVGIPSGTDVASLPPSIVEAVNILIRDVLSGVEEIM